MIFAVIGCLAQFASAQSTQATSDWSRSAAERDARLAKAESGAYYIRHIYISGNTYTRHRSFVKRMKPDFNEGYVFSRRSLDASIKRIAKMDSILSITIDDVEVMLDEEQKYIDFTFIVRQRSTN